MRRGICGRRGRRGLLRTERAWFTHLHTSRLVKLSKEPSFTGDILPRVSICREHHTAVARDSNAEMRPPSPLPPPEDDGTVPADDDEAEVESDDKEGMLADAFLSIVHISRDEDSEAGGT